MGADLIVYIMKGPAKISKARRDAALRAIDRFLAARADLLSAHETLELVDKKGKGWEQVTSEDIKRCEGVIDDLLTSRDSILAEFSEHHGDDTSIVIDNIRDDFDEGFHPQEFVDEFIAWWEKGGGRDTSYRPDPDDQKKKIQVCGDMSWGDSPEGYGYKLTEKAYWFGIPQLFGIR